MPPKFTRAAKGKAKVATSKRSRKVVESSSSSESEEEEHYESVIFTSQQAEDRYELLVKRSVIQERGFSVPRDGFDIGQQIHNFIDAYGWGEFCSPPSCDGNITIVKEFYANLPDAINNIVTVRGVKVNMSTEAINAYLQTPNIPFETEEYIQYVRHADKAEMASLLCLPNQGWTTEKGREVLHRDQLTKYVII